MKNISWLLLLLVTSPACAQFDSVEWERRSDSVWNTLKGNSSAVSDSLYLDRWLSDWSCEEIHDREDENRSEAELNKRWQQAMDERCRGMMQEKYNSLNDESPDHQENIKGWYQYMDALHRNIASRFPIIR